MTISEDELRENISNLPDEEIIVRWQSGAFGENAYNIACEVIQLRGLDVSEEAMQEITKDELRAKQASKKRVLHGSKRLLIIIFAFIFSTIGAVIAALLFGN
jgi:hypothetical protein